MYCGFVDSFKGAIVLFYMDKQMNQRFIKASPARHEIGKKDAKDSPSKSSTIKEHRYLLKITFFFF